MTEQTPTRSSSSATPARGSTIRTRPRYVSLVEIADMLQAERSVAVYDAGSGKDITPEVLAQIVARQH